VASTPVSMLAARNRLRLFPVSAKAPSRGDRIMTSTPAIELATPSRAVEMVWSMPAHQYCLKKTGKNVVSTVSANAELAQSYMTQPKSALRLVASG
jgi:hypothetical protein